MARKDINRPEGQNLQESVILKVMEFRTRDLESIVETIHQTELIADEKLELIRFMISTNEFEEDELTSALQNEPKVLNHLERYFQFTESAEKFESFLLSQDEIKLQWVHWYSNAKDATVNSETLRDHLAALLDHKSRTIQPEIWISNVLLRFRHSTHAVVESMKSRQILHGLGGNERFEVWNWIFDLHGKAELLTTKLQSPHSEVFQTLLKYEQAVLFNAFEAYTRALDAISICRSRLTKNPGVESIGIIHPFTHHPMEYLSTLTNLTKSRCGMHVDKNEVKMNIEFCIQKMESFDTNPPNTSSSDLKQLSIGVVHYFSILTWMRFGFQATNDIRDGHWDVFRALHPTFHAKRVENHAKQLENPFSPWAPVLRQALSDLISPTSSNGKRDQKIREIAEGGKDLASNNPLAPIRKLVGREPPLETRINLWITYIDMIKINFLRVTKHGGSHHLVRFGPIDTKSNELAWIKSVHQGKKAHEVEPEFFFTQYLAQGFRSSSDLRSTKMDRTNLTALIMNEMMTVLEQHCPPTNSVKDFIRNKRETRRKLQRPIFIPKQQIDAVAKNQDIPTALYAHVALERIFELQRVVLEVRTILELASIQETYRKAMKSILNAADENLALEFVHLLLIVQSHDVERSAYEAHVIVEKIERDFNQLELAKEKSSVNERNRNEQVRFDFLRSPYVQTSATERFASIVNDPRSEPFIRTLQQVQWWKHNIAEIDELKLAKTMVAWIEAQASADFVRIVHPRIGNEKSTYPYPK